MSIKDIIGNLSATIESYSPSQIVTILLVALAGGILIFLTYRFTTDSSIYNRSFNIGNVVVTLITAVIMMMISSNIIISLGMVGALSIVRFRTAVKEVRDTVFIFWAIVVGLCVGSQNFLLAALSSLFICGVVFAFSLAGKLSSGSYTLIVRTSAKETESIEQALKAQVRHFRLRAANTSQTGAELVYRIRVAPAKRMPLLTGLQGVEGVIQASLSEADVG